MLDRHAEMYQREERGAGSGNSRRYEDRRVGSGERSPRISRRTPAPRSTFRRRWAILPTSPAVPTSRAVIQAHRGSGRSAVGRLSVIEPGDRHAPAGTRDRRPLPRSCDPPFHISQYNMNIFESLRRRRSTTAHNICR